MDNNTIYFNDSLAPKILVCIFNHNNNDNALELFNLFSQKFECVVFDSGSEIKNPKFLLLDNIYYCGQFRLACEMVNEKHYDWVYCICSDVMIRKEEGVKILNGLEKISKSLNVGVYSPSVRNGFCDYWKNFNNGSNKLCLTHMINGFSVMIKQDIVALIFDKITTNKHGWGVDILTCYLSSKLKYLSVIDNTCEICHPFGTSYNCQEGNIERDYLINNYIDDYNEFDYLDNNNTIELIEKKSK